MKMEISSGDSDSDNITTDTDTDTNTDIDTNTDENNSDSESESESEQSDPFCTTYNSDLSSDSDTDTNSDVEILVDISDINKHKHKNTNIDKNDKNIKEDPNKNKLTKSNPIKTNSVKPKANPIKSDDVKANPIKAVISKKNEKVNTTQRTVMYYKDIFPVTAAGVVIYKMIEGKMQLLLIYTNNKYEDIGGKIDVTDLTIQDAAAREVEEETNAVIKESDIIERIKATPDNLVIYMKESKYVIYILKATDEESVLSVSDFGDYEDHDKIKRNIGWIDREIVFSNRYIIGNKLNPRIKSKQLSETLKKIETCNNKQKNTYSKSLFK